MQAAQDITIGGRVSKTQYQYTLDDADPGELNQAALFLDRIKKVPASRRRNRPADSGPCSTSPSSARWLRATGIPPFTIDNTLDDAFGQRIRLEHVHDLEPVTIVMEVNPKFQYSPEALTGIYVKIAQPARKCPYRRWSPAWSRSPRSWSTTRASSRR